MAWYLIKPRDKFTFSLNRVRTQITSEIILFLHLFCNSTPRGNTLQIMKDAKYAWNLQHLYMLFRILLCSLDCRVEVAFLFDAIRSNLKFLNCNDCLVSKDRYKFMSHCMKL
jgi:hypothetical protein